MARKPESPTKGPDLSRRQMLLGWRERWKEDEAEELAREEARKQAEDSKRNENAARLQQARKTRQGGDLQGAVTLYRSYVKANPNEVPPRRELGACLFELGQNIQARVEFERLAREPDPDQASLVYLGLCLLAMDRPAKALQTWKRFSAEEDDDAPLAELLHKQCAILEAGEPDAQITVASVLQAARERYAV